MASEAELGTIIQDAIARGVQELRGFGFAVIAPADRPALEAKVAKALSAERSCCPTYELCRFCTIDARIALDTIFGEAGE